MDDVVGLVMVNIVTTLGSGSMAAWPIARPIAASFGMLLVTLVIVPFGLKRAWITAVGFVRSRSLETPTANNEKVGIDVRLSRAIFRAPHLIFVLGTFVLVVYVTIADFVDGSVLFAAFLAGAVVRYLEENGERASVEKMYEKYYRPALDFMLVPFFFVS